MDLNALMRRIQQGDREAFATLYTRYNKTVYRIAFDSTHNDEEAKHVVVAVFREMYQTIRAKGPYLGDLYGWLDALTAKQVRLSRMMRVGGASEAPETPKTVSNSVDKPRRYTEEEAAALEERAMKRLKNLPEKEDLKPGVAWVSAVSLSITAVLLLWVLIGLLGTLSILPRWDLGYAWFNQTLFPLF